MPQMQDVKRAAEAMGESEEAVLDHALDSYITREIREASTRIQEIKQTYNVESRDELEENIESGSVEEHPAWEAVIEWENLEKRIQKLKAL